MRVAFAALLAAFAFGCGSDEPDEASSDSLRVVVEQTASGGGMYIEGAFSYIQVRDEAGDVDVEQRAMFRSRISFRFPLMPGEYRLISFQRPCGGNCGNLDPPTDRCEADLSVSGETHRIRIEVTPGGGCMIDTDPPT
jgi:hypothetical protein